jgi:alpha-glucosidase (family GH31 glycosyl hydrolase)
VARGYIERGLPISTIVIDWQHWVAQGDWHFNPVCWPDPQGMVDELSSYGIETMVTFWPFQSKESRYWQEFLDSGYLVNVFNATEPTSYDGNDQFLVDDTNPAVRASVFDKFWEGYGRYGIKTVWIDAAEPEHFGSTREGTWRMSLGTDAEVGEGWVQAHAKTFAEGFASKGIAPSDYFILPRSAWAGSWRYSAALWSVFAHYLSSSFSPTRHSLQESTHSASYVYPSLGLAPSPFLFTCCRSGDISSSFEELALQVKVLQSVMMSGVALWTTDIGALPRDPHMSRPSSLSPSSCQPSPPPCAAARWLQWWCE